MQRTGIGAVMADRRPNAELSWLLVGFLLAVAAANALRGELLWAGFALAVAALALVPPVTFRALDAMLPFELLLLAALPLLARTVAFLTPFRGHVASYLSVAAIALVVAVELHLLTPVRMNPRFAVAFVVVATMAAAGVWAVVRFASDVLLGTALVLPPGGTGAGELALEAAERSLMLEFVASFLAGVAAGVIFEWYFRRRGAGRERLPGGEEPEGTA